MRHPPSSWPFERPEQLAEALREQGAAPDEATDLLPALARLSEWQAPEPSPAETQRLLANLAPHLPGFSPVRQAIRERRQRPGAGVLALLATARAQVSLFGPAFWLVSALVTFLGAVAVLANTQPNQDLALQELVLHASGPLLAYLGTIVAFRGIGERVLECELVCLPSPAQLALARLVLVIGYDVGLGLALSLVLWAGGTAQVLALTLSWLMPLLLVAGLALLLSLRASIQVAASVAYGGWLAVLAMTNTTNLQLPPLTTLSDALIGCVGLLLLVVAILRLHANMHYLLPSM